jgi:hypothetical protein
MPSGSSGAAATGKFMKKGLGEGLALESRSVPVPRTGASGAKGAAEAVRAVPWGCGRGRRWRLPGRKEEKELDGVGRSPRHLWVMVDWRRDGFPGEIGAVEILRVGGRLAKRSSSTS